MEKRLIDANRLKAELRKSAEYHAERRLGYFSAIDHIDEQQTVDAVEVVRKPVVGYEEYYEVDQFGRVFSVERIISVDDNGRKYEKHVPGKQMKQCLKNNGYKSVSLAKEGVTKAFYVHRLVAEAFIRMRRNTTCFSYGDISCSPFV